MMSKISVPDNEIWYYANNKVTLYTSSGVVSHEFADGKGVIVMSLKISTVGEQLMGTAITNVELPSGVTSIGSSAFNGCTRLALTSLPSGVTSIGSSAFEECSNLALTSLPSGVTSIGSFAFRNCYNLALTSLPSGVTSIGYMSFGFCYAIKSLTIPISIPPTASEYSFYGTSFPIYVPSESVDTYKAANGWSAYASRIFPIS